jgi:plasmid stability protein
MHYNVIIACTRELIMKQLTIRGVDSKLHHHLKVEAHRLGLSINQYVLSILRDALGIDNGKQKASLQHHDLDHLAGTWTQSDVVEFERQLATQRSIDEDLWA